MQVFMGPTPWAHRPLLEVLVGQVVDRLGEPDGIIAFDPSSFPRGKRQWGGHRGVLHSWPRRHLSPCAPSITAQLVGPILPSPYPSVYATTKVQPRYTVGLLRELQYETYPAYPTTERHDHLSTAQLQVKLLRFCLHMNFQKSRKALCTSLSSHRVGPHFQLAGSRGRQLHRGGTQG